MKKTACILLLPLITLGYFIGAQTPRESTTKCVDMHRDYEMLCLTLNRQKTSLAAASNYQITAEIKAGGRLDITERRQEFSRHYSLPLGDLVSFEQKKDTLHHITLFTLKMKDSVLVDIPDTVNNTKPVRQLQVSFTLANPYLIEAAANSLHNICRDNNWRDKREKQMKSTH